MATQNSGPIVPEPAPKRGWRDAVKIMFAAVVFYAASYAGRTLMANVDLSKLAEFGQVFGLGNIPSAVFWGAVIGASMGIFAGIQGLLSVFLGREYLPPFVNWATGLAVKVIREVRLALTKDKTADDDKKTS